MTQPYGQQPPPPPPGQPGQYGQYGQQPPPGQAPYGQAPYGQAPYGQAPYGQPPEYVQSSSSSGRFNVTAGVLTGIAAILGILALTVLGWYRDNYQSVTGGSSKSATFSKLHDALKSVQDEVNSQLPAAYRGLVHFGVSTTYFGWLGYLLLAAAVILAFAAAAPIGAAGTAIRILGALVALAGIGLTLWALDLIQVDSAFQRLPGGSDAGTPSYGEYLKHTSFGAWAMLLAFVLCLVASVMGPKRDPASGTRY